MEPVVITGIGVVSALGGSADELTRRFAAGEHALETDDGVPVGQVPLPAVPREKGLRLGRLDRLCRFLIAASYLAVEDANLDVESAGAERTALSFGTGLGCLLANAEYYGKIVAQGPAAASPRVFSYTVSSAAAGEVSIALGIKGPNVTCHMGLAAGLGALGYGHDLIRAGKADVVLAAGADVIGEALVNPLREMGLLKRLERARPFHDAVAGICPGEAAVVMVLEREGVARRRGAARLGTIEGWSAGFEPTLTRAQRDARGVSETFTRALRASGRTPKDVGLVVSSAHGTEVDAVLREAMKSALGAEHRAVVVAPKEAVGETMGAAGMLGVAIAVGLLRLRPPLADGVGFDVNGVPLGAPDACQRLIGGQVAVVESTCYSGNVASVVLTAD